MIGTRAEKGPIIRFDAEGMHGHDIATFVERAGVAGRARRVIPLLKQFGVLATCLVSFDFTIHAKKSMCSCAPCRRGSYSRRAYDVHAARPLP
ncbi:hypothetical protein A5906_12695 [Bradyrhizobium sacchari]|nr:hypothetical protein A5906_12695 [Bradyrhizobium sacchari]